MARGAGLRPPAKAVELPPDPTVRAPALDPTGEGPSEKCLKVTRWRPTLLPVRFGRGRLDSLGNTGLAAYLIAEDFGLPASVGYTVCRSTASGARLAFKLL